MIFLVVDDDVAMVSMLERYLRGLATEVRRASSIQEAIEQMGVLPPPDLVLLDLRLTTTDAVETVAATKALREFNPNLKIVAISGLEMSEIVRVVSGSGIEGILAKTDLDSQNKLLRAVQSAAASGVPTKTVLARIDSFIENMSKQV